MRDFALEVYFSKWEFAAKYNLTGSDGENMTLAQLLALASPEAAETVPLSICEVTGVPPDLDRNWESKSSRAGSSRNRAFCSSPRASIGPSSVPCPITACGWVSGARTFQRASR